MFLSLIYWTNYHLADIYVITDLKTDNISYFVDRSFQLKVESRYFDRI